MSIKLNNDILFFSLKKLQGDSPSLFSCLLVNRLWCETAIPILWRNPWRNDIRNYVDKHRNKHFYLFVIIAFYLPDDVKKFLTEKGTRLPSISHKPPLFDYLSFCKSFDVNIINNIISFGSSLGYNKFLLRQEFYNILMKKCSFKYLDMISIEHQIFYFPKAKAILNSLCELKCDTSTDYSYFYGLADICQNIQRLIIINENLIKANHGIVKLIEVQTNLKYFQWKDDFGGWYFKENPYSEIFSALKKKADVLNHLIVVFHHDISEDLGDSEYTFMQNLLPELYKLKTLKIDGLHLNEIQLKTLVYQDLEVFNIDYITINTITCMIKNNGGHLKEILLKYNSHDPHDHDNFDEDSLILIRTIYENCPLIEYLSLALSASKEHFSEFEKLLKVCQNLKSLMIIMPKEKNGSSDELLKILIKSAPANLREIRFLHNLNLSLKALETFLEKWKGRSALSILTSNHVYNAGNHVKLISKYKNNNVIKDFRCDFVENVYF